jgi:hypothetical protein
MRLLKFSKRENEHERCLCLWTPWFTVVWDFGSVQCRGTDEFELVIKYKAWGPVLYFGNRDIEKLGERAKFNSLQFTKIQPRYAEQRKLRIDARDYYEHREQFVRQGKKKNPADMSYPERHAATMEIVGKMKFSENFMHLMTTPVAKLALERGEDVKDDVDGTVLTDQIYNEHKEKNLRLGVPNAGLLGFRKAEHSEGYGTIRVPGSERREIASSAGKKLQLEDGQ